MRIELSLLSVLSVAFLLMVCMVGNEITLDSLSVDFALSSSGMTLDINPTWLVWVSQERAAAYGGNAVAYGNVMVVREHMRCDPYEEYVINHELMHVDQFRALGWLVYPARYVLAIEQPKGITTDWNDPTQPSRTMWAPPDGWEDQWSFITLTFDREGT